MNERRTLPHRIPKSLPSFRQLFAFRYYVLRASVRIKFNYLKVTTEDFHGPIVVAHNV
jgi:hypothetical protein